VSEENIQQIIAKNSTIMNVKSKYCDMRDSLSLLLSSAKKLGEALNLPKLDMHKDNLEEYCYRDCEIIFHFIEHLSNMLNTDVESLKLTLGSEMHSMFHQNNLKYSHKDGKGRIINTITNYPTEPTPQNPSAYNYRPHFHGARCEVYNHDAYEKVFPYDINSMYCYIQTNNKFPIPPYFQLENRNGQEIGTYMIDDRLFGVVCDVTETHFAPFISERDENNRLIYRNGKKENVFLFREEIEYCLSRNYKIDVKEGHYCSDWDNIFEYLKPLYQKRMDTKLEYEKLLLKGMIVRSFGKFAEKQTCEKVILVKEPALEYEDKLVLSGYKICNGSKNYPLLYSNSAFLHKKINLVIAMRITALAKLLQQKYIDETIEKNGLESLIYTDTDSIFTDKETFENSKELGQMKLEPLITNFTAISRKFYISLDSDEKSKIKGIPNKLNVEDKIKFIGKNGVHIDRPIGFKEAIKKNMDECSVIHQDKSSHELKPYREVFLDGSTLPFDFIPAENKEHEYRRKVRCGLYYNFSYYCPLCKKEFFCFSNFKGLTWQHCEHVIAIELDDIRMSLNTIKRNNYNIMVTNRSHIILSDCNITHLQDSGHKSYTLSSESN
jgi:hypothetical protein